jgi:hypothetical protein
LNLKGWGQIESKNIASRLNISDLKDGGKSYFGGGG